MPEVVIIGGGVSGLSAAYRILREQASNPDIAITLLEESSRLGGALCTEKQEDFVVEHGSDSFITNKPWAKQLCLDLRLNDEIVETSELNRRSLIAYKGKLIPVPEGFRLIAPTRFWPFIASDLFSWAGKVRVAMEMFMPPVRVVDDESVASFVARRFGRELLQRAAQPMVGGIYTGDVDQLCAQSTLTNFVDLEAKYGSVICGLRNEEKDAAHLASGARYAIFNSLKHGLGSLIDRLSEKLPCDRIRLNCKVLSLQAQAQGWTIVCGDGSVIEADATIIATPARHAGALLETVDPGLSALLKKIENASSVVINFLFRLEDIGKPIQGFGFVVPAIEGRSIIACSAISAKFGNRAPEGMLMLRVFMAGSLNHDLNQLDDNDLKLIALAELNSYLKITSDPVKAWVKRWPNSMPQYKVGHRMLIAKIEEGLDRYPRLALAGNSYEGVGIPDCVRSADKAALKTLSSLRACGLLTN